jgi:hypothetical protein
MGKISSNTPITTLFTLLDYMLTFISSFPLGSNSSPRDALLPPQNRLPPILETPQRRKHNSLQRSPHSKHPSLCLQRSRQTREPRPRHSRRLTTNSPSLRANDQLEPLPSARLRTDRNVWPNNERVPHACMGRTTY